MQSISYNDELTPRLPIAHEVVMLVTSYTYLYGQILLYHGHYLLTICMESFIQLNNGR